MEVGAVQVESLSNRGGVGAILTCSPSSLAGMEQGMLWFKHFSDSLDDPFIQKLLDKFSHRGYIAYFGLIEVISKESGTNLTGKLSICPAYLSRKLRIRRVTLALIYDYCATLGKLSFDNHTEEWCFDMPKMLKLKDNYTRDLEVSTKRPSKHKEVEVEEEKDKEKKKPTKKKVFVPPSSKEVEVYAKEIGFKIDGESFLAYYEATDWMRGKSKIKSWKQCVVTWKKREESKQELGATLPESMKRGM